jgi:hypothetical protein
MVEAIQRDLTFSLETSPKTKRIESDYYVEGYATTFERYVLFETQDGEKIYEQFSRDAFNNADLSDVILQFDHSGNVFARVSNGTLGVEADDNGLFVWADLSRTNKARELYEDIKARNVTKMSIRCSVEQKFDETTNTNNVTRVKHVYDVSAVSIPANNGTSIVARSIEEAKKEKAETEHMEQLKVKMALKIKLEEI